MAKKASELVELVSALSPEEQREILKSLKTGKRVIKTHNHTFSSDRIRFGYFSDSHIGAKEFDWLLWEKMATFFRKEKIKVVYSPGDIVEGMSGREGQIYDLEAIGFQAQIELAAKAMAMLKGCEVYSILGNHDLWFKSKGNAGANVGEELEQRCDHFHCLGEWEADVTIGKGVTMKLFHAGDGSAYAVSYKLQKLIESLEGGNKPSLILSGHYHKQIQMFTRNVFGFECGTLCGQTRWMRGKKIPAHKGFGVIEIWVANKGGIERLRHEFFPHYD